MTIILTLNLNISLRHVLFTVNLRIDRHPRFLVTSWALMSIAIFVADFGVGMVYLTDLRFCVVSTIFTTVIFLFTKKEIIKHIVC